MNERLLSIRQGKWRVSEYALDFCIMVAESGWNETAPQAVFRNGLNENIFTELACSDNSLNFDSLIELAIRLDSLSLVLSLVLSLAPLSL